MLGSIAYSKRMAQCIDEVLLRELPAAVAVSVGFDRKKQKMKYVDEYTLTFLCSIGYALVRSAAILNADWHYHGAKWYLDLDKHWYSKASEAFLKTLVSIRSWPDIVDRNRDLPRLFRTVIDDFDELVDWRDYGGELDGIAMRRLLKSYREKYGTDTLFTEELRDFPLRFFVLGARASGAFLIIDRSFRPK